MSKGLKIGSKMVTVGVYILVTPKEEEEEERISNY
jgi:hypothetical protein